MRQRFFILLFCFSSILYSQKYDLDRVTVSELEEKEHPLYPDAEAAVLFEKGSVRIVYDKSTGFSLETEVLCKIKIYKSEGFKYATVQKSYISDGNRESVSFSKAFTYNLVNGKVEKTRLKSDGEFIEKLNKNFSVKKITFPGVKEGSIIEYRMFIKSGNLDRVIPWGFQKQIPVNHSHFSTVFSDYITYSKNLKGYYSPTINTSKSSAKVYSGNSSNDFQEIPETKTEYILENIEPIDEEDYVYNIANYASILNHELASYQFPNLSQKNFSNTWQDVAKFVNDHDNFGKELRAKNYFENDVQAVLLGVTDKNEKVKKIFEFVKNKLQWNKSYGVFCDDGVKKAYKNNTGNVSEINLILTAMLRNSGFNANPVLLSTRTNGVPIFPSVNAFNYVACGVEVDNKILLLDATDELATIDVPPLYIRNWIGRMIKDDGSLTEIDLSPDKLSRYQKLMNITLSPSGEITGIFKGNFTDYAAFFERRRYIKKSVEDNIEQIENRYKGIEVENLEFSNIDNIYEPFGVQFDFKTNSLTDVVGDKLYISPLLFLATSASPFTKEDRKFPVDFPYPYQDKFMIYIEIPEGYKVEFIPENQYIKMEGDMVGFRYMASQNGNRIQIVLQEDFNANIIDAVHYKNLKNIFEKLIQKENEKIVLVRG